MRRRIGQLWAVTAALTFFVGPFLWQTMASFERGTAAYEELFADGHFARALLNSFVVALLTALLALTFASLAAFALGKLPMRGKGVLLGAALAASTFPPIATVSPLFLIIRALGLRDTLTALVLTNTTFALPLALWVLTSFFKELPDDLYRAARIDGCTPLQAFTKVLLPLAAPGLATTGLLVFVFSWNEFLYALTFVSSPDKRTVPVAIALFAAEHAEPWAQIAAASVVATLPLLVLTLMFQRRLISGLTAGGVKG